MRIGTGTFHGATLHEEPRVATGATRLIGAQEVASRAPELARVYESAFGAPPYNEGADDFARLRESLARHSARRDFRCAIAERDGDVIGFAYGYRSEPGQWWHDAVSAALAPAVAARWLAGCFEVVEVAVAPSEQRRGVGTALHGCLLDGLTQSAVALSVMQDHGPAVAFYRRLGGRERSSTSSRREAACRCRSWAGT